MILHVNEITRQILVAGFNEHSTVISDFVNYNNEITC